ncbi:hypothetical protein CHLNCDRAFT_143596 [Chlorella variabilis]|uniref:Uncharacterized protein n=1 Tax=Chlorella variabilis TaxID=554065 RepID=E1ZA25_CHLVA|nr:hypothetical protein CHLNCDRAFT_143596 [Chlorella variabilis]EFN57188.1 hypothetical protein CHLNCDRAFT_143596 [Chlorella variabilis]|eukprot:XP_005849290.1 hypothetical protein CHLNCDRAFT_143596 [Chlorella variabilis]
MPDTQPVPGSLALILVGLDRWRFITHSTDDGAISHTAESGEGTVVHCGVLPAEQMAGFRAALSGALAKAAQRKGDERSAAGGGQGHQKTPAMVRALVLQALDQLEADEEDEVPARQPQGGFTDVGLHTGGAPRDTAWPLVREAIRATLGHVSTCRSPSPDLFQLAEAHLHLWLLQRQVPLVVNGSATSTALNAAMQMTAAVASVGGELAVQAHDVAHVEAACRAARLALEGARAARVQAAASDAQLPALAGPDSPCGPGSYRLPRGVLPPLAGPQAEGGGLEEAIEREGRNLGSLLLPPERPPGQLPFADLLAALSAARQHQGSVVAQHALCMVEREMFQCAVQGFGAKARLPETEVDSLVEVVNAYLLALHTFQGGGASEPRMQADLRSRGVLVVWPLLPAPPTATLTH